MTSGLSFRYLWWVEVNLPFEVHGPPLSEAPEPLSHRAAALVPAPALTAPQNILVWLDGNALSFRFPLDLVAYKISTCQKTVRAKFSTVFDFLSKSWAKGAVLGLAPTV